MLQKNNKWTSLLFGIGLLFVLISFLFLKKWNESASTSAILAKAEEIQGQVFLTKKFTSQKIKALAGFSVSSLDTVETSAEAQLILEFPSSYRVRLLGNSVITLEENGDQTLLILKQGNFQVENFGKDGSLFVSHQGRRVSATEFELERQNKTNLTQSTLPAQTLTAGSANPAHANSNHSLSQDDIQSTLQKHKPMFFKCYTQLLQKTPGITGQVSLAFVIEKNGKISQPEITNSSISDPKFRACLLETLSRVDFRAFAGDPVSTVFPLKFE